MTSSARTEPAVRHAAITAVVCLALAAVTAAMSSLNVALPDIARATHASQTQLSWIVDAHSLVFAALLLPGGALGDRYGRRRALIIGLTIFAGGSAAATLTSSPDALIAVRGLIGLGAALVMPATLSTITGTFPAAQRVKAVSIWAGVAGAAAVVGLLVSGSLLEAFSWRSVFGVNVVLALIALLGTVLVVPESADRQAPRFDAVGALLSVAGLVVLVYSIIEAPSAGWLSARSVLGLLGALAVLTVFVVYEQRRRDPMLDPRIFGHRRLAAGSLSIFVQFFVFFGFIFVILQYLQIVRSDSALIAAFSMLPMALGMMPASRLAPRVTAAFGSRRVCVVGLLLIAVAMAVLSRVDAGADYWVLAGALLVLGVGAGVAMTPATSAITAALPNSQQGVASAVNDLSREVGGALGIAVLGSIMTTAYQTNLHLPHLPAELAEQARQSVASAHHFGAPIATQADNAFIVGLHLALLTAAVTAAAAAVVVGLTLPGRGGAVRGDGRRSSPARRPVVARAGSTPS